MARRAWLTGLPSIERERESRSRTGANDSRSERHRTEQDYRREPRTHGAIRYQSLAQLHDFTLRASRSSTPGRLSFQQEESAVPIGADRAVHHLASARWLELNAFVAAFVTFRVILIRYRLLRYLDYCSSQIRHFKKEDRSAENAEYSVQ